MRVFEPALIGRVELKNRLLRSATFEGLCAPDGSPGSAYADLYAGLSSKGLGALITGFAFINQDGKSMQPGQAGIDSDAKIAAFSRATQAVHLNGGLIFLQLAHAGRQTVPAATGGRIYAPSPRKSSYFNHRPCRLTEAHIERIIRNFAEAARRAQAAGFDGVQLHAAHGYLIHQFLHPAINDRTDGYRIDSQTGVGTTFLDQVIDRMRSLCGPDYPLLVKVSAGDDYRRSFQEPQFIHLIRFLDSKRLDAIEISFGTMDHALNIFRGQTIPLRTILNFNPRYATRNVWVRFAWKTFMLPWLKRKLRPFTPTYNLAAARLAKQHTTIPIICVGGFRSGSQIRRAVEEHSIDFISLARPLICEPDFVLKISQNETYESRCVNCNQCAIMCDSGFPTRCYTQGDNTPAASDSPKILPGRAVNLSPFNQEPIHDPQR